MATQLTCSFSLITLCADSDLEVDIFSDDATTVGTLSGSDTDLKAYVVEGQTIGLCGHIDLGNLEIDGDLNITVPIDIELPYYKPDSGEI